MHQIKLPLKKKMLDKNEVTLTIVVKLKLMFTSYAELLNGSIMKKVMRSFWSPPKKEIRSNFLA